MLDQLLAEIDRQGGYADGGGAEPVVGLELFFDGNDDLGSIGCNLAAHPGTDRFFAVLRDIRDRPEVSDVLVGISEVMGEDEWPFSDHVYVITTASAARVAEWAAELEPEAPGEGWWNGQPPAEPVAVPPGARVVTLWWD
jgi:hypothetical protein